MRFKFEAMDATGMEIRDTIEAETEEEACEKVRSMGYFVTRLIGPPEAQRPRANPPDEDFQLGATPEAPEEAPSTRRARKFLGWICILVVLLVILAALYVGYLGFWVMLIGGICDAVDIFKADTYTREQVAIAVLKIIFFELPLLLWFPLFLLGTFFSTLSVCFFTGKTRAELAAERFQKGIQRAFNSGLDRFFREPE